MPVPEPKIHAFDGPAGAYCGADPKQLRANIMVKRATCNKCLQIAYRRKLKELVEIATQANIISCNLTTFHTLRDFDKLSILAQRNRNLFVANNEEEQDD